MAPRPIFTATHPRAVSTAFERVFMTRRDTLQCVHEPFGDAFYYGPEFMSQRFEDDAAAREASGLSKTTYADVVNALQEEGAKEGKRVFIKDMAYYLFRPDGKETTIAPSLAAVAGSGSGSGSIGEESEAGNPTRIPLDILRKFQFTFLIRHPRRSIPSYWRCCLPPLVDCTGFTNFMPSEAGYAELVKLFQFLVTSGIVDRGNITMIDADDMLDNPEGIIKAYCNRTGIDYKPEMLVWTDDDREEAARHFAKWNGFHDDALGTSRLEARTHAQKKTATVESENEEWTNKYGVEAQKVIRETVDANIPHYMYLKQFCLQV